MFYKMLYFWPGSLAGRYLVHILESGDISTLERLGTERHAAFEITKKYREMKQNIFNNMENNKE